jgi:hypothetical protein
MRMPIPPSELMMTCFLPFAHLFRGADFERFVDHCTCLMTQHHPACLTDVQRHALEPLHYSRHRDFVAHGAFEPATLLQTAARAVGLPQMTTRLSHGREVLVCVLDDTLRRRPFGRKLFGVAYHHDHAARSDQNDKVQGQCLTLLGVIPHPLAHQGAQAWLCDAQLWVPFKRAKESEHDTLPYESKLSLAAMMLDSQRAWLDPETERILLVDALYPKASFFAALSRQPKTYLIGRLANNRAVFLPPGERISGQKGRPRIYGARVDWKVQFEAHRRSHELRLYGREVEVELWGMTGRVRGYAHDVRLVVSKLPKSKPHLFLCTDLSLSDAEIIRLYAARFSIEEAIKDEVLELALGCERGRSEEVYSSQMALKLCAGLLLRQIAQHQPKEVAEALRDPWRKASPRLTMGQVRKVLYWECLSAQSVLSRDGLGRGACQNSRPEKHPQVA